MRSSDRMRLGMTYMSELAVFPDLSIEENIRVGAQARESCRHGLAGYGGQHVHHVQIRRDSMGFLQRETRALGKSHDRIRR